MAEKRLTKEIAEQFLADDEYVDLHEFTEVDDDAAESLSKHDGLLSLDGLTSLSETAAESLSKSEGGLSLDGLTSLSDVASARPRSRWPTRGRAAANRHQLQRFLQRADWAFDVSPFSRKRLRHLVRVLAGALRQLAPHRTPRQTPAKQGFSHARCGRLATPCETKRRVAAPDFAPLLRSGRRSPAGSASPRWAANSLSQVRCYDGE